MDQTFKNEQLYPKGHPLYRQGAKVVTEFNANGNPKTGFPKAFDLKGNPIDLAE